ncbi:hypothetical protein [Candidatus Ferrigenium straubiae]|jgi:hypothetical protein|uniref:hypothetical protein n=1 Tax=Candidatus Ferrigenium straubiae TaxID=2919506 RepID=UPI003F4ADDA3
MAQIDSSAVAANKKPAEAGFLSAVFWFYLLASTCCTTHKENRPNPTTQMTVERSAIIAIFSSLRAKSNTITLSPSRENRSTILWANKPFFDKIPQNAPAQISSANSAP